MGIELLDEGVTKFSHTSRLLVSLLRPNEGIPWMSISAINSLNPNPRFLNVKSKRG